MIDDDYLDVMGVKIISGRTFAKTRPGDRFTVQRQRSSVLLNETAVREFGIDSPLGKAFPFYTDLEGKEYQAEVIGIIKDFHLRSFHHKVEPLMLFWTDYMSWANVRISSADMPGTIKLIKREWEKVYGDRPFVYDSLDVAFNRQYKNDESITKSSNISRRWP